MPNEISVSKSNLLLTYKYLLVIPGPKTVQQTMRKQERGKKLLLNSSCVHINQSLNQTRQCGRRLICVMTRIYCEHSRQDLWAPNCIKILTMLVNETRPLRVMTRIYCQHSRQDLWTTNCIKILAMLGNETRFLSFNKKQYHPPPDTKKYTPYSQMVQRYSVA